MGADIEQLARFVAETPWEAIPDVVRQHAKLVLLDTWGVLLAGSEELEVRQLRERLLTTGGQGATVFARGLPTTDPRTAALLNGTAGRSIELCEGHRYVSCQGAVQIVPALLALGEQLNCNGRELLTALILGYEAAVRLGTALTARALAHQNGQAPLLGAVAATARLQGLPAADTSRALRLAATLVLTPSYTNAVAGATILNVAGGMSGFVGALVPTLTLAGFRAQADAVEEAFSHLVGEGFIAEHMLDELGQHWEICRNYFRLRACCNPIYAALDALEAALADLHPEAAEIARIEVTTYRFASVMRAAQPVNSFAAKYSLPHAAAALIVRGHLGHSAFTPAAVNDPAIAALRQRVFISEESHFTSMVPDLKPAQVTVVLRDGRRSIHTCHSPRGDFQQPYAESALRVKFRELAGFVLTPEGVAMAEAAFVTCEHWDNINTLTVPLHRHSRSISSSSEDAGAY